ncbi:transcriptional regulator [Cronobacter phage S13]|uniref:DsDNA binding protein n=1 Tax=Cronobacter phage LPCS28 TaxID=2924885 RepID=A0AAE9G5E0_9CAUD|nr:transcriptional regulator [Cronobacter phage S13]YP_010665863.1 transcriptional regulator [Cronobacter phage LPCS28]AIA64811.1 putative dsDNA binding protein [Cronobacter phage S13]UNY47052.1 hypothetical protein EHEKIMEA_00170 [Cronobacter phage LPCS28]
MTTPKTVKPFSVDDEWQQNYNDRYGKKPMKPKKEKKVFNADTDSAALADMIKEASNVKTMMEAEGDKLKDIKDRAKSELGVESSMFNSLLKIYHKQERDAFESQSEEVVDTYDRIFKK